MKLGEGEQDLLKDSTFMLENWGGGTPLHLDKNFHAHLTFPQAHFQLGPWNHISFQPQTHKYEEIWRVILFLCCLTLWSFLNFPKCRNQTKILLFFFVVCMSFPCSYALHIARCWWGHLFSQIALKVNKTSNPENDPEIKGDNISNLCDACFVLLFCFTRLPIDVTLK